jgi:hypothetical protein
MSGLLELAERCEKAMGPDRGLDAEIYALCGRIDENHLLEWRHRYTSSIDAAMTLVPKGMILRRYMATRFVPHGCEVGIDYAHGGWVGHSDHSMPLALCAAALRARGESQ